MTEYHLEFLSLKGCCKGSSESNTLLEITCHGSNANLRLMRGCTHMRQSNYALPQDPRHEKTCLRSRLGSNQCPQLQRLTKITI